MNVHNMNLYVVSLVAMTTGAKDACKGTMEEARGRREIEMGYGIEKRERKEEGRGKEREKRDRREK